MNESIVLLCPFDENMLKEIWKIGFTEINPEWNEWNAPYFDDYTKYESFEEFSNSNERKFFMGENVLGIKVDGKTIGMVSRYWEDKKTRWLEIGIVIYDKNYWNGGFGTKALRKWITKTFRDFSEIEHVGLTTWSGNIRMMKAAEKLGMQQEARIRKVRYYNDEYYDSVKYGILREEWSDDYE